MSLNVNPRLPPDYTGTLAFVGTVTFSLAGTGANAIGIYQVGTGTAAGTATRVATGAGAGIPVPPSGFSANNPKGVLLVAGTQFSGPTTLKATFTWDPAFQPPAASQDQLGINESTGFAGSLTTSGASSFSTTVAAAEAKNAYSAVDYLGINPRPTIVGPRNVPGSSFYIYTVENLPAGLATAATWSVTSGGSVRFQNNHSSLAAIQFSNTAQVVTISATATVAGNPVVVTPADVAVVMVTVGSPTFIPHGTATGIRANGSALFGSDGGTCTTYNDPGSDFLKFKYSGGYSA